MSSRYQRIVVIGFRGTGKSTVARLLGRLLKWEYISTDQLIEEKVECPIAAYVAEYGWEAFRRVERQVVEQVGKKRQVVIDCGGGVVEDNRVMQRLMADSLIVWLDAEISDIVSRIARQSGTRPLLNQPDLVSDVESNYRRRLPLYARYGKLHVNSSRKTAAEICQDIRDEIDYSGEPGISR